MVIPNKLLLIIAGAFCGSAFAPVFFLPAIVTLSFMCRQVVCTKSYKEAGICGYLFALGLYLSTIYWMAIGVSVYAEEFWWFIPFALFGLPAFIAIFYGLISAFIWQFRKYKLFHFIFCISWVFVEWLISWIFTGLPWTLMGYVLSVSNILVQSTSVFGVLGLSFFCVYIGSSLYTKEMLLVRTLISALMLILNIYYGVARLEENPTELSDLKVRIVQPSIPQVAKWNPEIFWQNLHKHIELSNQEGEPDIIVWSEASLTAPYYYRPVFKALNSVFTKQGQILLFGGFNDNKKSNEEYEIYSSLLALNDEGELLFDYRKSHLVPFGEYIPFEKYIPMKKITHGMINYTAGNREILYIESLNLYIQPLICYESIFAEEVRLSNSDADLIVNITNDSWYGNSSGPYQHFEISKMRAIENGIPLIRAGNNGISAIIDPVGRVLHKLNLNEVGFVDGLAPLKLIQPTIYSQYGSLAFISMVFVIFILQLSITHLCYYSTRTKNTCQMY
jgi:apolipoprotein N-acyltransferase